MATALLGMDTKSKMELVRPGSQTFSIGITRSESRLRSVLVFYGFGELVKPFGTYLLRHGWHFENILAF